MGMMPTDDAEREALKAQIQKAASHEHAERLRYDEDDLVMYRAYAHRMDRLRKQQAEWDNKHGASDTGSN